MSANRICLTPRQLAEFLQCEISLQGVLFWIASNWPPADLEVTRIHSSPEENQAAGAETEIHVVGPPFRAIDVRVTNLPGNPQEAAESLGEIVNRRFVYDPARPAMVVAYVKRHGTGPHVHLQVHPRTTLRDQERA